MSKANNSPFLSLIVPSINHTQLLWFLEHNRHLLQKEPRTLELIIILSNHNPSISQTIFSAIFKQTTSTSHNYRLLFFQKKLAFAPAVNTGFSIARGTFWGTINDDAYITTEDTDKMISNLRQIANANLGCYNPAIINITNNRQTIESLGISISNIGRATAITDIKQLDNYTSPYKNNQELKINSLKPTKLRTIIKAGHLVNKLPIVANGAMAVYNSQAILNIGGFANSFQSYLEDLDLGLRLYRAGYDTVIDTGVVVIHKKHQSMNIHSPQKAWLDLKNWILLIIRNWTLKQWKEYWPMIILERGRNFNGLLKAFIKKIS